MQPGWGWDITARLSFLGSAPGKYTTGYIPQRDTFLHCGVYFIITILIRIISRKSETFWFETR